MNFLNSKHTVNPALLLLLLGLAYCGITKRGFADEPNSEKPIKTRQAGTFEEAYSLYRNARFADAQAKIREILTRNDSADARALRAKIRSALAAKENLKQARENDSRSLLEIVADLINDLRSNHNELKSLAEADSDSAVIQELLGESANNMKTFLSDLYAPLLEGAGQNSAAAREESRVLKEAAIVAYRKAVQLDSQHAVAYVRLAGKIGDVKNPLAAEYLLQAIEKAPGDPQSIKLLAITMWQSAVLADEKQAIRAQQALMGAVGAARTELQKVKRELDGELRKLSRNIEGTYASGFASSELEASFTRLSKTLKIIESVLQANSGV